MATLKLDLIRRGRAGSWRCLDAGDLLFCARGFASVFGRTRLSRCTLEVRTTTNPRKKGWIKITLTNGGTRVFLPGGGSFSLLYGAVTAARVAGLIPLNCAPFDARHLWVRASYRKAKRSPR